MKTRKERIHVKDQYCAGPQCDCKKNQTPGPWKVVVKSPYAVYIESETAPESRLHICKMDTYAGGKNPKFLEADAAHIVKCVNSHEALLKIAKDLVYFDYHQDQSDWTPLVDSARETIAKAEGR